MPRPIATPQAALLFVLSSLCPLCLCGESRALDPELTTPYKVQVVLRVAEHPLLTKTPIFKDELRRELREGLRAALGAMGEVEVFDAATAKPDKQQEALWKLVETKGLRDGLDEAKGNSGVKTHFISVDYVDGQYEILARQYDGLTGLASPAVRMERTPDRQFVARTAALLIARDFGVVGTVTGVEGTTARVAFKGGGLKVPLDRWVKKGDLFALVHVGADGRTTTRRGLTWVLLQADGSPGEDGSCACKLLPPQPRALSGSAGVRCLKLGTVTAPVRLRITDGAPRGTPRPPSDPVVLYVRRHDFNEADKVEGGIDADGYFSTEANKEPLYDGLAFVTITLGGQTRALVPLALVDERTVTIPLTPGGESADFLTRRALWETRLLDEQLLLDQLFPDLNEAIGKADSRARALDRARTALDGLIENLAAFGKQREELAKAKAPGGKPLDLSKGDARLKDLQEGRQKLAAFVANTEKVLKEENDPARQQVRAMFEQAHNLEGEGDYGRAIELYEKVLAAMKDKDPNLAKRLPKLKEAWEPKSDEHRKARQFIYETWPKLESPATMKERIKQADEALTVCEKAKDPFGPQKLLKVALLHAKQLSKQLEGLDPDGELDRKPAEELADVLGQLEKLGRRAAADVQAIPAP
jgi:hypothetical protein